MRKRPQHLIVVTLTESVWKLGSRVYAGEIPLKSRDRHFLTASLKTDFQGVPLREPRSRSPAPALVLDCLPRTLPGRKLSEISGQFPLYYPSLDILRVATRPTTSAADGDTWTTTLSRA